MQTVKPASINRASADDIESLVALKLQMFAESGRAHLLDTEKQVLVARDYAAMYADDAAAHFVVRRDGAVIACAGAFLKSDLPYRYFTPPIYGFIGDVYTLPAARNAGLARQVSSAAIEWLKSRGVTTVRLLASDAARPIYLSMGFRPSDEMVLHLSQA
jgi:GNAT superfamily N-acetyltransferase